MVTRPWARPDQPRSLPTEYDSLMKAAHGEDAVIGCGHIFRDPSGDQTDTSHLAATPDN
jgi:hypothetical protein